MTVRVYSVAEAPQRIPRIAPDQTPNRDWLLPTIDLRDGDFGVEAPFVTVVIGEVVVSEPGERVFRLTSDDGARLTVGGRLLIDHDGRHGFTAMESAPVMLGAGRHPLLIEHFDAGGRAGLRLEWKRAGEDGFRLLGEDDLRAERDLTRVTSPGVKRVEDGRRPGDGAPVGGVHPAWTLVDIRPPGFDPKVGAMGFLPDGRLVVGTFDPLQRDDRTLPDIESKQPDGLYALDNLDAGDPAAVTVTRIATDLYEPTGICVVDGVLYVAHRRAVVRLLDTNGDGFFETHEVVGEGWEGWNYHQFAFGLVHIDAKLCTALSTSMAPPGWEGMEHNAGPNGPMRGGIVEIDIASGETVVIAGGTRTPNGLGLTADGALIYTDNQGTWMPTNQIAEVIPGRFYGHYNWTRFVPNLRERFPQGGHPSEWSDRARAPAAVLMAQNEVSNSPTEPLAIRGGVYDGQVLVGELTAGGVRRVAFERVNGQLQGALFRFTQGIEAGVNRMAWGPDGSLYVGCIGAGGNWNWRGTQHGLQRLVPNGTPVFEMHSVTATPTGFRISFTDAVDPAWLADPANYLVRSWTYRPTGDYGGPKVGDRGHAAVRATPGEDGRSVVLDLGGIEPGRCYHIRTDPVSVSGEAIWSTEAWYTVNAVPHAEAVRASSIGGAAIRPTAVGVGVQPPADAVVLTGRNSSATMRYRDEPAQPPALSQDDFIAGDDFIEVGMGSGDLISTTSFGDTRLHIEWYCPPGGSGQLAANSGVFLQDRYEIQVLGTPAGTGDLADNEAGAIYGIRAPDANASAGPGAWQAFDIWFRAPRFEGGKKTEDARLTVYWNGRLVHDDVAIPHPTGSRRARGETAGERLGVQIGPLVLQDHASRAEGAVRFRNVWIAPLERASYEPGPWEDLFDAERPDDWIVRGGEAGYELRGGELIGTTRPDIPNSFYTSARSYGDFELVYETKVDPRLNSGVQIRSALIGGERSPREGLRGYQVELDPSDRAYSGGIFDERRRGWLHPLHAAPSARRAFRPGEWNRFRVVATGPVIRTWINGVPAAEIFDAADASGRLGFQVHGVGGLAEPLEVRFRHARIRELTPAARAVRSD
ncbi:MAG: DUF1080 domain-containing protein [Phycisphaerales bacterium]|nr:DUF1080 domain-containing protein [Planctomycetota bacterium]MCH8508465.1 DUF1080 domain-containing protein [Phycisphaerales bacterium]